VIATQLLNQLRSLGVAPGNLCIDSRQVAPGDVFLAWPGARVDGRKYMADVVAKGAAAVLYEAAGATAPTLTIPTLAVPGLADLAGALAHEVYGHPSAKLWLCGITGTNGKTSISQWIAQALDGTTPSKTKDAGTHSLPPSPSEGGDQSPPSPGRGQGRCAVIGTLGNGFVDQLRPSPNTTPDAITLQRDLASFVADGAVACAMEVSSIGLDQGRANGCQFHTAVFTNLTRDHLEDHGTMEAYGAAKARLFQWPGLQRAVINLDDAFGRQLAQDLKGKVPVTGYSLSPDVDGTTVDLLLRAEDLTMTSSGQCFTVQGHKISVPLLGRFNTSNLLAVLGALLSAGLSLSDAVLRLEQLAPPPGRMECLGGDEAPLVVVDYAHTPDALEKALITLRETATARSGRLLCLFGCGGDRDPGKRPLMGAVAEQLADAVLLTSDNPRSEDPQAILDAIARGMKRPAPQEIDRASAIARLVQEAANQDVVLLAGKGHETYQEIFGQRLHLSDLETARLALETRS
jgi:UDP-N-acetylmuramoyl-L-alanyl-D-glutamate--2,6-diaminopimelate ligase